MDKFWALDQNKVELQQFFIKWVKHNYTGKKNVYLGGSHPENMNGCLNISGNELSWEPLLSCYHEEADDRLMYHVKHAIESDKIMKVIIASSDTDVLVCSIYHFSQWMYSHLQEMWIVSGCSTSKRALRVHEVVDNMNTDIVDILPAVHALTGCDTSSKVGTKKSAFKHLSNMGLTFYITLEKQT